MSVTPAAASAAPSSRTRRTRARWALAGPLLVVALLAAGCGDKDELKGDVVKDGIGCTPEVARQKTAPTVEKVAKVGKKVITDDDKKGKGCEASPEGYLSLDLVGAIASTGKVFTSTFQTGHPLTVQLAQNQLVAGLETGLTGMKVGGRRTITIPAAQAYGKDGNKAQGIGANEDLTFVVDLLAQTSVPEYCSAVTDLPKEKDGKPIVGKPLGVQMPLKVPTTKVETNDLKVGTGKTVKRNSYVTVKYYGISCIDGRQFDSSYDRGPKETLSAALGTVKPTSTYGNVIPGWTPGLTGAKVGTIRQMDIPFQLAYGAAGQPPSIAANASLVFVVEVISTTTKAPKDTTTTTAATTTAPAAATTTTTAAGDATTTTAADATTTTTAAKATTTTGG